MLEACLKMSLEKQTLEEQVMVCDYCGKTLGIIEWKEDLTNSKCPICGEECDGSELKYVCIDCRGSKT